MIGLYLFVFALLAMVISVTMLSVKSVPQGLRFVVERFGKYNKTLEPGLRIILPMIDHIAYRIDMREQIMDIDAQEIITQDNARVEVDGVAYFQVIDAVKAAYEIEDFKVAVRNIVIANIRSGMGSMNLDDLSSKRDEVSESMLKDANRETMDWGVRIKNIRITDIAPPKDLLDAMAKQMIAEREKRATIIQAEGDKTAAISRAEGEKQAQILRAEGERETELLQAEARRDAAEYDARARELIAKAEANAILWNSQAIAKGGPHAVNYFIAQQYMEVLGKLAAAENQKVIMMPLEASHMIGALSGIAELTRQTPTYFTAPPNPGAEIQIPESSSISPP
jgi:regulator of protease activity HflC (stomatin/prohibitin superfamily)